MRADHRHSDEMNVIGLGSESRTATVAAIETDANGTESRVFKPLHKQREIGECRGRAPPGVVPVVGSAICESQELDRQLREFAAGSGIEAARPLVSTTAPGNTVGAKK